MKFLLLLSLLFAYISSNGQTLNFLDNIDTAKHKTIVLYTISSWCSGNIDDFHSIKDAMSKYRSNYHLILLLDTISTNMYNCHTIIDFLQPNQSIFLNNYFPKRLHRLSENKAFTKYVNRLYNSKFYRLGPGTLLIFKNSSVIAISAVNRPSNLTKVFEAAFSK